MVKVCFITSQALQAGLPAARSGAMTAPSFALGAVGEGEIVSNIEAAATAICPDMAVLSRVEPAGRFDPARLFDIAAALVGLIFLAPLMIAIVVAIKLDDGGAVLFGHERVGRAGRMFRCWKFRSMVPDAEARLAALLLQDATARAEWAAAYKLRRDPRATRIGAFLRRSSLDELPQLFNVLRGEMSLVGPRPIVRAEIVRYGRAIGAYGRVRPGITGLWQVSGRSDITYRRRVAMDVLYARRRSLALDLAIVARTVPRVLGRKGSY